MADTTKSNGTGNPEQLENTEQQVIEQAVVADLPTTTEPIVPDPTLITENQIEKDVAIVEQDVGLVEQNNAIAEQNVAIAEQDVGLAISEPEVANNNLSDVDNNLIDIINSMESDRQKFIAHVRTKISTQETEFEKTKTENERLKKRVAELELSLRQNNINVVTASANPSGGKSKKGNNNKNEEMDVLTQAKTLLFEKTKLCKQQEQQLAAFKAQVDATKEVLQVTKEMLCLRNIENDHTGARLDTMELKLKNERARQQLYEKKLEVSTKAYAELRSEYDIQSNIFKQLRAGYEDKITALTKQIDALKS